MVNFYQKRWAITSKDKELVVRKQQGKLTLFCSTEDDNGCPIATFDSFIDITDSVKFLFATPDAKRVLGLDSEPWVPYPVDAIPSLCAVDAYVTVTI